MNESAAGALDAARGTRPVVAIDAGVAEARAGAATSDVAIDADVADATAGSVKADATDYAEECGCDWSIDYCLRLSTSCCGIVLVTDPCRAIPAACAAERTCACLEKATGFDCTEDGGALIVTEMQ